MCYTNQEKPIEELILNTKELDFAKSYHEKQMKIVEAVNVLKLHEPIIEGTRTIYRSPRDGKFYFGLNFSENNTICTIEEYNQCIEEMKYHYDIPRWCSYSRADKELLTVENSDYSFYEKETFVHGQDVYVDRYWASNPMKFGCFTLDSKKALLFDGDGYCRVTVESISSKPIKSKEDIELEEAKKKQVHDSSFIYSHYFKSIEEAREMFLDMQKDGRLAEIILPLEKS